MRTARILLVEDDPGTVAILRRQLAVLGHEVVGATATGEEAVRLAEQLQPQLVLIDIGLEGGLDGIAAAQQIQRRVPAGIVFMTASVEDTLFERARHTMPNGYLVKPIHSAALEAAMLFALASYDLLLQLRASEERYREVCESSRDLIQCVLADGHFQYVNPAWKRTLGYADAEVPNLVVWDIVHPDSRSHCQEVFQKLLTGADVGPIEATFVAKDGRPVFVQGTSSCRIDEGQFVSTRGVFRDVTLQRQTEATRRELEVRALEELRLESLSQFANGVSHDLNNLMTTVLGYASLIGQSLPLDAGTNDMVRQIETAALRGVELGRQLLAYSGRGTRLMQPVNLSDLVQAMSGQLQATVHNHAPTATLQRELAADLPLIEADVLQLRQLVLNLVVNAAEALGSGPGQQLTIRTLARPVNAEDLTGPRLTTEAPEGERVILEVTDNGSGMSPAMLEKIFEPFYTTRRLKQGLGLPVVLGIVRGHRAALQVVSSPGEGSTFRLFFAPAPSRPPRESPAEAGPGTLAGKTILVIDDESGLRNLLRLILEGAGARVLLAADGREGLSLFQAEGTKVAAITLDLEMPVMRGEVAFAELKRLNPGIPVVLTTACAPDEVERRLSGRAPDVLLHKPYNREELLAALRRVLS